MAIKRVKKVRKLRKAKKVEERRTLKSARDPIVDITAYPTLTEGVGAPPTPIK